MSREIICNIGDAKLGRGTDVLRATLGSCVGIALIWRDRNRCALAHCLLAEAPRLSFEINAKYVTQAMPSLLTLLKVPPEKYHEIEAVVVGGAQMMGANPATRANSIGQMNSDTALRCLKEKGIKIIHLDIGGECGRQIAVDCHTFQYQVRSIAKSTP